MTKNQWLRAFSTILFQTLGEKKSVAQVKKNHGFKIYMALVDKLVFYGFTDMHTKWSPNYIYDVVDQDCLWLDHDDWIS